MPRPGASALSRAPIPYSRRPRLKQRLRPQRSVSLLQGIIRTAMISRNRVIVVWTPLTVVSRSSLMSLIITFMFEPAKLQMNWASASGARNLPIETAEPARAGSLVIGRLRLGDGARGEDQSEVGERLGEVAHLSPAPDVVLLGE